MANPHTFQFDLSQEGRPQLFDLSERWYPGITAYADVSSTQRLYDPIDGIRAVVIHATDGSSSSGAVSVIEAREASFHWLVPDEDEPEHGRFAWACIPEHRAAWHVQNVCHNPDVWNDHNHVNHFSLGIEIVNSQTPSDPFSDWQVGMAAEIVRHCWAKYPNLRHVVSHAKLDPTRRSDPGTAFPWESFRQRVLAP